MYYISQIRYFIFVLERSLKSTDKKNLTEEEVTEFLLNADEEYQLLLTDFSDIVL